MTFGVRRIRESEWERVRDLRLGAVRDPDAAVAFLHSYEEERARPDEFWRDRAAGAAEGDAVAQFIAESAGDWIGTLSVLRRMPGSFDHHGRAVHEPRADVVGVYVRPQHRGRGVVDRMLEAAAGWVRDCDGSTLTLDVHADNLRAQGAYRRAGFAPTGLRFTGSIGPELEMARDLHDQHGAVAANEPK